VERIALGWSDDRGRRVAEARLVACGYDVASFGDGRDLFHFLCRLDAGIAAVVLEPGLPEDGRAVLRRIAVLDLPIAVVLVCPPEGLEAGALELLARCHGVPLRADELDALPRYVAHAISSRAARARAVRPAPSRGEGRREVSRQEAWLGSRAPRASTL
jgi:hypothetical protein